MSHKKPSITYNRQEIIDYNFHSAVANNTIRIVIKCLKKGAEINGTNNENLTAAQVAIEHGYHKILALLSTDPNFDLNLTNTRNGNNLFEMACIKDDFRALQILCADNKFEIYVKDKLDNELLHYCAMHNSQRICTKLLDQPIALDVNILNRLRQTPLHIAVIKSNLQIIRILLRQRMDINFEIIDSVGASAIQQAIAQINVDALQLMICHSNFKFNRTLAIPFIGRKNLFEIACIKDDALMAKQLFDNECAFHSRRRKRTVFHLCSKYNSVNVCKIFIRPDYNFIDINALDGVTQKTALHEACATSNTEIVLMLLKRDDIALNLLDRNGYTAIGYACRKNRNIWIVKALINKNVDINYRNPLATACKWRVYHIVEELLSHPDIIVDQTNVDIKMCITKWPHLFAS